MRNDDLASRPEIGKDSFEIVTGLRQAEVPEPWTVQDIDFEVAVLDQYPYARDHRIKATVPVLFIPQVNAVLVE